MCHYALAAVFYFGTPYFRTVFGQSTRASLAKNHAKNVQRKENY